MVALIMPVSCDACAVRLLDGNNGALVVWLVLLVYVKFCMLFALIQHDKAIGKN